MAGKNTQYDFLIKILGRVDPSLKTSVQYTKREMKKFESDFYKTESGIWKKATGIASAVAKVGAAAGVATGVALKKAYDVGSEFEKHMDEWSATADASNAQYEKAREAALLWGRKTTKTATESADALKYMALAGWDVNTSIKALPSVLKLSEATNLDLARTSDLVTDAMSATGTEAGDLARFLDVAAKANNRSNQTAEQLLEGYIRTGAQLHDLHVPIEESATAFGVLANRGLKAEEAGTALRSVLINLTTGAGSAGKMMDKLGVSAFDDEGRFIGLKNTMMRVNDATRNMSDEQRNAALSALGGKRNVAALSDMLQSLNNTLADGRTEWDALREDLDNAGGALNKMSKVKMDNLWGDLKILESAMQDAGIRAYDGFSNPLRDATQLATKEVYKFSDNVSDKIGVWYPTIKRNAEEAGKGLKEFTAPMFSLGKWLLANGDSTVAVLAGIAGGITTLHAAVSARKLSKEVIKFTKLFSNPIASPIMLLGTAATVLVAVATKYKIASEAAKKAALDKTFGNIALSEKELHEVSRKIIGEGTIDRLVGSVERLGELKDSGKAISDVAEKSKELLFKVRNGIQFTSDDSAALGDNIKSMIEDGLKIASEASYTDAISVRALFGNDEEGKGLIQNFASYNEQIGKEISEKGEELGKLYSDAIKDGAIDSHEAEIIEAKIQEYQNITDGITRYVTEAKQRRLVDDVLAKGGQQLTPDSLKNLYADLNSTTKDTLNNLTTTYEYTQGKLEKQRADSASGKIAEGTPGYISADDYNAAVEQARNKYIGERNRVSSASVTSSIEAIMRADSGKYQAAADRLSEAIVKAENEAWERAKTSGKPEAYYATHLQERLAIAQYTVGETLSNAEVKNLQALRKSIEPQIAELRAARDEALKRGLKIDPETAKAISLADNLDMLIGDKNAIYKKVGSLFQGNEKQVSILEGAKNIPEMLKKGFMAGLKEKQLDGAGIADSVGTNINSGLREKLNSGFFMQSAIPAVNNMRSAFQTATLSTPIVLTPDIRIDTSRATMGALPTIQAGKAGASVSLKSIDQMVEKKTTPQKPKTTNFLSGLFKKNALGGIYDKPILTEVAEAGDAEAIIPINRTARAAELYKETGRRLAAQGNGTETAAANISLTINVAGNADRKEVEAAGQTLLDRFGELMRQYQRREARTAF
nr:MAG TPA: minor tail protein [Caudoviricetes sp.]